MTVGLIVESLITGEPFRIVNYNAEQYFYGFVVGALSTASILCKIVAFQNEKSGLITMLAYIGLVYAFLGDLFIFEE